MIGDWKMTAGVMRSKEVDWNVYEIFPFSFFAWKSDYQIDLGFPFSPLVCGLCRKLHQSSGYEA